MKKNIGVILLGMALIGSLGYIACDAIFKEEKVECKECEKCQECNKEELCDKCESNNNNNTVTAECEKCQECNVEQLCQNNKFECNCNEYEEDDSVIIDSDTIVDKNGKALYELNVYNVSKMKVENIKLNNKTLKFENKDNSLYVNNKKVEEGILRLYVTNNYVLGYHEGCQIGICRPFIIDENGNKKDVELNNSSAYDVYLAKNGNLIAIGEEFCGMDCSSEKMIVRYAYKNGKVEVTTDVLK